MPPLEPVTIATCPDNLGMTICPLLTESLLALRRLNVLARTNEQCNHPFVQKKLQIEACLLTARPI
jgi:hypothetical protein